MIMTSDVLWLVLSHNFIQAKSGTPYTIKASTVIRDSGLVNSDTFRFQVRAIDQALRTEEETHPCADSEAHL